MPSRSFPDRIAAACRPPSTPERSPCALSDVRRLFLPLQLPRWSDRIPPAAERIRRRRGLSVLAQLAFQDRRRRIQRTNSGAPQHPYFIMGGGQYTWRIGRESVFVEGLAGVGGANQVGRPTVRSARTASFSFVTGGGLDTALRRHLAFRVEGGYQYSYFALQHAETFSPYRIPGLPASSAASPVDWSGSSRIGGMKWAKAPLVRTATQQLGSRIQMTSSLPTSPAPR